MNVFTVHPSLPVKTIKEFVAHAKTNPGKIVMAIGGIGSSNHLTPVWFANIADLKLLYVPFKGSGDSITALLGGEVFAFVDNEPSILAAHSVGPHSRVIGHGTQALESPAQRADDDRVRLQGLRGGAVVWISGSDRYSAGGHPDSQ